MHAFSSPNTKLAKDFASSVFPTPVGPTKNSVPFGFFCFEECCNPENPVYARIITSLTLEIAKS